MRSFVSILRGDINNVRSSNTKQYTDGETHLGISQVVDSDGKEHV